MSLLVNGPGAPYTVLLDTDTADGLALPAWFHPIYGNWSLAPAPAERPCIFTNFVASHDGRISFNQPGREGGGEISRRANHDTWLMGLIRARADALLVGATTLRILPHHRWTPAGIFPADSNAFAALRAAEDRPPHPLLVIITLSGELPPTARALNVPGQQLLIATTGSGAERARALLGVRPDVNYHLSPGQWIDLPELMGVLRTAYNVRTLLSEAGPRIYGLLLNDRLIDEAFLTVSPIIVGNPTLPAEARPGLVEGVAFSPDAPPKLRLLSLRHYDDYLFQRVCFIW